MSATAVGDVMSLTVLMDHQPDSVEMLLGVVGAMIGLAVGFGVGFFAWVVWELRPWSPAPSSFMPRLHWYHYAWAGLPFFLVIPVWAGGFLGGALGALGFLVNVTLMRAVKSQLLAFANATVVTVLAGLAFNEGATWL